MLGVTKLSFRSMSYNSRDSQGNGGTNASSVKSAMILAILIFRRSIQ